MAKQTDLNRATTDIHRELVALCRKGDRSAQYRLYKLYSQAMYNICLRMVPEDQEAQDILQEAFIKAFGNLRSFRGDCTFGVWLKRIVINQCLSYLRKKRPLQTSLDEALPEETPDDSLPESLLTPELVNQSIYELPDKARVIFNLFHVEGYSHKEIAQLLEITESTSKTQVHRARLLLRQKITDKIHEIPVGILH